MLSNVMLNVIMLSCVTLNVVMLSVMATPDYQAFYLVSHKNA